jgi:hypothetical protein
MNRIFFIVFMLINLQTFSQSKGTIKDYEKKSAEVDALVWGVEDTLFSSNKLPEIYKNESAVILARKDFESNLHRIMMTDRVLMILNVRREKVFINDQAALKSFSEISYNKVTQRDWGMLYSRHAYSFVGIRIIKPDGAIKKIDVDLSSINLDKDEETGTQIKKIAVPGLEIGDIIDYYIGTHIERLETWNAKDANMITFATEYPILKYKFVTEFSKNFFFTYYRYNGAPALTLTGTDEDPIKTLSLYLTNIEKNSTTEWNSPKRNTQRINLEKTFLNSPPKKEKSKIPTVVDYTTDKEKLDKILDKDFQQGQMFIAKRNEYGLSISNPYLDIYDEFEDAMEDYAKDKIGIKIKNMSSDQIFEIILPVIRKKYFVDFYIPGVLGNEQKIRNTIFRNEPSLVEFAWPYFINKFYTSLGFYSKIIIAENRLYSSFNSPLAIYGECEHLIELYYKGIPHYLSFQNGLLSWDVFPKGIDGSEAKYLRFEDSKEAKLLEKGTMTLPKKLPSENSEKNSYQLTFQTSNFNLIELKRSYVGKGALKVNKQEQLELLQTYAEQVFAEIGITQTLISYFEEFGKKFKKSVSEFDAFLVKEKGAQKKMFTDEAKEQFDIQPKELKKFTITKHGLQTKDTTFEMEEELVLDGLVKNAGSNYIFDFGKLLGPQIEIKPAAHTRKENIYMPYPRQYIYNIQFNIPDGYSCEGIEKLNVKVENETGGFVSIATVKGNLLNVDIKKYYSNGYEPVANWPKMTAFLDACFEFTKVKLLLKKK